MYLIPTANDDEEDVEIVVKATVREHDDRERLKTNNNRYFPIYSTN